MAQKNSDGTVTLKTRGSLAYAPRAGSSITRSASRGPGVSGPGGGDNGRFAVKKGSGYTGTSAYR